jgi:hypothetical protein
MEYNENKVDEIVLALLHLTTFENRSELRAWKGHDWNALDRLHEKGYISDPKGKAKSVVVTEDGARRSSELFKSYFGMESRSASQR